MKREGTYRLRLTAGAGRWAGALRRLRARDPQAPARLVRWACNCCSWSGALVVDGGGARRDRRPASPSLASLPIEWRLLGRISFCSSTWRGLRGSMRASCVTGARFADLERWQIAYLPVYARMGGNLVVVMFPARVRLPLMPHGHCTGG